MQMQFLGLAVLFASLSTEALRKLKREFGTVKVCTENFIYRL
jgi:hypothetical protein